MLGGYVVIRLYTEKDGKRTSDCKIGGTIEHVLFPYHIKRLKLENKWYATSLSSLTYHPQASKIRSA